MIVSAAQRALRLAKLTKGIIKQRTPIIQSVKPTSGLMKLVYSFSEVHKQNTQKMQFKTETKRLLDIVAKSLYTDQEVFVRQLLSNASDALEKQRLRSDDPNLSIKVTTNETKKQLIIEDNGIGMAKEDLMNNLGTIARSGSRQFVEQLSKNGNVSSENIIGQFGVGFYSSFIVADYVDVISVGKDFKTHCWSSDGTGSYEISQVQDSDLAKGTRIILHIKPSCDKFIDSKQIKNIVQKYSNFITFPVSINGDTVQMQKALWSRDKRQLTDADYEKLYSQLTNGKKDYFTKIHYSADVPLSLKSILYIPNDHMQKYGVGQEPCEVSLYSKKVLIKKNCRQLLPNHLRFVKGVVDCEDITLNISRQNYQDSALIFKIQTVLTNRIHKHLKEEAEKNPLQYNKWLKNFNIFIKQGSLTSSSSDLLELNRFKNNLNDKFVSLKEYAEIAKESKLDVILYYIGNQTSSPYLQPFNNAKVPVLVSQIHLDEIIFKNIGNYENMRFINIETSQQDVSKYLGEKKPEESNKQTVKDAITFSLWVKHQLQPIVSKVEVSKKNISGPGLVYSPISSSMRQLKMFQMMNENANKPMGSFKEQLKNITFQINAEHELMIGISELRKTDNDTASLLLRQVFDNCCIQANLQTDKQDFIPRINKLVKKILDNTQKQEGKQASRK